MPIDERKPRYVRMTLKVPEDLAEKVRNAVFWLPALSLTGFVRGMLEDGVLDLERTYNDGKPFPLREAELRRGRPMKGNGEAKP